MADGEKTTASVLKTVGVVIVLAMVFWLFASPVTPNHVQGRIILGFVMIGLGYLIDIKLILERRQ